MGITTVTIGTIAALTASTAYYLRRRISRSWINFAPLGPTDLSGKVVIITGANVGLGYESAKDIARRKGTVVLACRDVVKGRVAADRIKKETGNDSVDCLEIDLASLESVKAFATVVTSEYKSIYALVCNAGVWMPMEGNRKTKDGYEVHFGVNHLGHFALARSIVSHMAKSTEESRIVWVSSGLMKSGKLDIDKRDFVIEGRKVIHDEGADGDSSNDNKKKKSHSSFAPIGYCDSKLMNALTCRHLASILTKTAPHVTTYAVCPGFCRTSLGRHVHFPLHKKLMFAPVMLLIQRTSVQGAQNILHVTLEDRETLKSGQMYRDGEVAKEEMEYLNGFGDDVLSRMFWELSEKLVDK